MLDLEPIRERLDEATPGPWDLYVLPQSVGITAATIHSEHGPRETCWTVDLPPEIGRTLSGHVRKEVMPNV